MHGLAVHGLHLFHVSSPSHFYYSSFIQAYVDHGKIGLSPQFGLVPGSGIMNPPQTRTLDDSKHQWKQSRDDPALWQREALAVENLWPLKPKEVRELFLVVELLLFEPIDAARISSATQEAWKELQSGIPRSS